MEVVKIRYKREPLNIQKTEKQRHAASITYTKIALKNNPMKNPEVVRKMADARRGKKHPNPHMIGNKYGSLRKNKSVSERTKDKLRMKQLGRKGSEKQKESARKLFTENNPMKNFENASKISKKIWVARKRNIAKRRRERFMSNPNIRENWFKKGHITPEWALKKSKESRRNNLLREKSEIDSKIVSLYNSGLSIRKVAKELNLGRWIVESALKRRKIKMRKPYVHSPSRYWLGKSNPYHLGKVNIKARIRMLKNNPMKNPEVVRKMLETKRNKKGVKI